MGPTIQVQTPHADDHNDDPLAELYVDEPLACDACPEMRGHGASFCPYTITYFRFTRARKMYYRL